MDAREPPIATLPRQARPVDVGGSGAALGELPQLARAARSWTEMAAAMGYARQAALLERRLGWILWTALLALVLVISV